MSDLRVEVIGLDDLLSRMRKAPEVVSEEMLKGIDRMTLQGQALAQKGAPVDTGNLRRSITTQKATFAGGVATGAFGTNLPYAAAKESGRGAGKPMPPPGALVGWMTRHGIPLSDAHESTSGLGAEFRVGKSAYHSIEFLIARAIGRRGIEGKHYMRKAHEELLPKVQAEFKAVVERIVIRMGGG